MFLLIRVYKSYNLLNFFFFFFWLGDSFAFGDLFLLKRDEVWECGEIDSRGTASAVPTSRKTANRDSSGSGSSPSQ